MRSDNEVQPAVQEVLNHTTRIMMEFTLAQCKDFILLKFLLSFKGQQQQQQKLQEEFLLGGQKKENMENRVCLPCLA